MKKALICKHIWFLCTANTCAWRGLTWAEEIAKIIVGVIWHSPDTPFLSPAYACNVWGCCFFFCNKLCQMSLVVGWDVFWLFSKGLGILISMFTSLPNAEISSAQSSWVEWKILESSTWPGPLKASFVDSNRTLSKGTGISLSFWYRVWSGCGACRHLAPSKWKCVFQECLSSIEWASENDVVVPSWFAAHKRC